MAEIRTFGRMPTLGEMKEYYARDDVLSFLYDECQIRNVDIAYNKKRFSIDPTSKAHLRQIIEEMTENRIERAYRNSQGDIDNVRLKECEYISFHARTTITSENKLTGFDTIFEADMQGWRRAFEDLVGVVRMLDDFGVCYRIKYSGVRSLHFMIPFEAFPKQFNGKSVLSQRAQIQNRLGDYFRKHCGMKRAHGGGIMRLGYSLNEDNGLVSLPIASDELTDFRPWETNIYNVDIDKPWHSDVPTNASRSTLKFLREIYRDDGKSMSVNSDLKIAPKERSRYASRSGGLSVGKLADHLRSDEEAERLEAAWNLMATPEPVPISVVEKGLEDGNPDIRWYLTEALQKSLNDGAIELAARMLWDSDQFVRIGAIDTLALAGEKALDAILNSMSRDAVATNWAFTDVVYALQKIHPGMAAEKMKLFLHSAGDAIADSILRTLNSNQPLWHISSYINQFKSLCKQHGVSESILFRSAIDMLVPEILGYFSAGKYEYHWAWLLCQIRKNQAIPLMILREIADSLNIHQVKISSNRMDEDEREFLTRVIHESLADTTVEQKAYILAALWIHGRQKISVPAKELIEQVKKEYPPTREPLRQWLEGKNIYRVDSRAQELMQNNTVEELVGMLNQNWSVRMNAILALSAKCETNEDVETVMEALSHRNSKVRMAAVKALGGMQRLERASEAIREGLNAQGRTNAGHVFPRWDIRRTSLKFYIRSKPRPSDAVDVLLRAVDEWRSATALHDAVALFRWFLHDERIVSKLREVVVRERFPMRARRKAQRVLQHIPDGR